MKFIYQIKREYRLQANKFRAHIDALVNWYMQKTCPHIFRPARVNGKPGQVCEICDVSENLTPADYYAKFGEKGWQQWQ